MLLWIVVILLVLAVFGGLTVTPVLFLVAVVAVLVYAGDRRRIGPPR